MLPGKPSVELKRVPRDRTQVDACIVCRLEPTVKRELLRPRIEARSTLPRAHDNGKHISSTSRESGLDERGGGIMVMDANRPVVNAVE